MSFEQQRSTVRCAVFEERPAVLFGKRDGVVAKLDVRICDESSGGFGLTATETPPFELEDRVIINSDGREILCRIVHIGDPTSGEIKIGLKIEEELLDAPEKENVGGAGKASFHQSGSYTTPLICALIVLGLTVGGLFFIAGKDPDQKKTGRNKDEEPQSMFEQVYEDVFGSEEDEGRK